MATMTLDVSDGVHVLSLINHDSENKLNLDVIGEYAAALDEVEQYQGNTALLIRCEHEKTFSTGIDLDWLMSRTEEQRKEFVLAFERVLYRIALLNAPTVVALNGNAYAGGAILASACDFKLMRADLGRFCFPEVNIKIPFTDLMMDIVSLMADKQALKVLTLTGKPFTGIECEASKVVDAIYPADELQAQAFGLAKMLADKDRATYTAIRNSMRTSISRHATALGLA